ncbi:hypothetical protein [Collimonas pratensis]|uniref:Lipoprotein n=1 Tax=Collimonas pratensis TaxID=279113 RepID=A0A127QYN8_9BURK|nr:hypothetical protein [Collimonas pratensis]AMP04764.1 putative lipoprotein [Collimonas pratensis]AMP15189.1 putative lipoprotein [Collimonas pratensis]
MKSPLTGPFLILATTLLLAGCDMMQPNVRSYTPPPRSTAPAPAPVSLSESLSPSEQVIDVPQASASTAAKRGELSDVVERMARRNACTPAASATLIAKTSAVETYQISCQDGQQQLYKCELRQCRLMN